MGVRDFVRRKNKGHTGVLGGNRMEADEIDIAASIDAYPIPRSRTASLLFEFSALFPPIFARSCLLLLPNRNSFSFNPEGAYCRLMAAHRGEVSDAFNFAGWALSASATQRDRNVKKEKKTNFNRGGSIFCFQSKFGGSVLPLCKQHLRYVVYNYAQGALFLSVTHAHLYAKGAPRASR